MTHAIVLIEAEREAMPDLGGALADVVIPVHYDTFPPIETDAEAFKSDVENATETKVVVLAPGETHTVR